MAVPAVTSLLQARTGRPFSVSLHLEPRRCAGCAACPNAERKASWRGGQRRGCGAPRAAPCGRHRCCMLSPQPCGRLGRRLDSLTAAPRCLSRDAALPPWSSRCSGPQAVQRHRQRRPLAAAVPRRAASCLPLPLRAAQTACRWAHQALPGAHLCGVLLRNAARGLQQGAEPRHSERRLAPPPIGGRRPQASLARRCPVPGIRSKRAESPPSRP